LLDKPKEQLPARGRFPAIEAEGELVEVVVQVLVADRTLESAKEPALQERDHAMDVWKQVLAFRLATLDLPLMGVSTKADIRGEAVGTHDTSRFNRLRDERLEPVRGQFWDAAQADASDPFAVLFGGDDNQRLVLGSPSGDALLPCAPIGFVDLDGTAQPLSTRTDHCASHLMQHDPGCPVAPQSQNPLKTQCAGSGLLTGDEPHGAKPDRQGEMRILEDRPRGDGDLMTARSAKEASVRHSPEGSPGAAGAHEPLGPAKRKQVFPAGFLGPKPLLELRKSRREILFHGLEHYMLWSVESSA
jgi:hypothetical protein